MTYEIIKISPSEHHIVKTETKEVVSVYTRMSSAKRGLERLLTKELAAQEVATVCTEQESASATATQRAQARGGVGAVAQPPASNTGGQKTVSGVQGNSKVKKEHKKSKKVKKLHILQRKPIAVELQTELPETVSTVESRYVMINGEIKEIPVRKGLLTAAHIDTLTVVIPRQAFFTTEQWTRAKTEDEEDELLLNNASEFLLQTFGFGLSVRGNGRNGYKNTAEMGVIGDKRIKYGFIAWSVGNDDNGKAKQGDTVCLHLSGTGITAALDGWERRLYDWLALYAPFAKITRCDLAHDFFNGEYTPIQAYFDWVSGQYNAKSTRPVLDTIGLGWHNEPDKGRTVYIGSRKNGSRVVRVYEKGIEQGDKTSAWVRFELQLRNRDIIIPLDILLYPGEYLTSAYPICETLFTKYTDTPKKTERVQKQQEISVEHCIHHMSIQASPTLKMLVDMGFTSDEVLQIAINAKAKMPKRLHPNAFDASYPFLDFIKQNKRAPHSHELKTFVSKKYLDEQTEQAVKAVEQVNPEQLYEFRECMREQMYLDAAFGKHGFTATMRREGMTEEDYISIRYGSFKPKQTNCDLSTT